MVTLNSYRPRGGSSGKSSIVSHRPIMRVLQEPYAPTALLRPAWSWCFSRSSRQEVSDGGSQEQSGGQNQPARTETPYLPANRPTDRLTPLFPPDAGG